MRKLEPEPYSLVTSIFPCIIVTNSCIRDRPIPVPFPSFSH
jgi:hypothetical protein